MRIYATARRSLSLSALYYDPGKLSARNDTLRGGWRGAESPARRIHKYFPLGRKASHSGVGDPITVSEFIIRRVRGAINSAGFTRETRAAGIITS
jgi:hypothetical protein